MSAFCFLFCFFLVFCEVKERGAYTTIYDYMTILLLGELLDIVRRKFLGGEVELFFQALAAFRTSAGVPMSEQRPTYLSSSRDSFNIH